MVTVDVWCTVWYWYASASWAGNVIEVRARTRAGAYSALLAAMAEDTLGDDLRVNEQASGRTPEGLWVCLAVLTFALVYVLGLLIGLWIG